MIGNFKKQVDKYRIRYQCNCQPKEGTLLSGFQNGEVYEGRYFNGLYEVSVSWGRETPLLISRKLFNQYFELMQGNTSMLPQKSRKRTQAG